MLCCAVLYCAVLYYAVLCCAVLCRAARQVAELQANDMIIYKWQNDSANLNHLTRMYMALHDDNVVAHLNKYVSDKFVVGVMGGHAMKRADPDFLKIALLCRQLAQVRARWSGDLVPPAEPVVVWWCPIAVTLQPGVLLSPSSCVIAIAWALAGWLRGGHWWWSRSHGGCQLRSIHGRQV